MSRIAGHTSWVSQRRNLRASGLRESSIRSVAPFSETTVTLRIWPPDLMSVVATSASSRRVTASREFLMSRAAQMSAATAQRLPSMVTVDPGLTKALKRLPTWRVSASH
ncbi:hypothetical protein D522_15895 [Mycobacterium avium subsp. paratuberculosis S5]|nr:hypothetical protein D522_15895 [Mycobacterium avium subsp. paratuberculosis S5]